MALFNYTGRLTNAQRRYFAAARNASLYARPKQPGIGATGLITNQKIPIDIDLGSGNITMQLEESASVRPRMVYDLVCEWQQDGQNLEAVWAEFYAPAGGGAIGDVLQLEPNPGTWSHGDGTPTQAGVTRGLYVDRQTGDWWMQERTWI